MTNATALHRAGLPALRLHRHRHYPTGRADRLASGHGSLQLLPRPVYVSKCREERQAGQRQAGRRHRCRVDEGQTTGEPMTIGARKHTKRGTRPEKAPSFAQDAREGKQDSAAVQGTRNATAGHTRIRAGRKRRMVDTILHFQGEGTRRPLFPSGARRGIFQVEPVERDLRAGRTKGIRTPVAPEERTGGPAAGPIFRGEPSEWTSSKRFQPADCATRPPATASGDYARTAGATLATDRSSGSPAWPPVLAWRVRSRCRASGRPGASTVPDAGEDTTSSNPPHRCLYGEAKQNPRHAAGRGEVIGDHSAGPPEQRKFERWQDA